MNATAHLSPIRTTVDLPRPLHRSVRHLCLDERMSYTALVQILLSEAVRLGKARDSVSESFDPVVAVAARDRQWQAFLSGKGPHPLSGGV
ncbi:hypothetical protein [Nocardioides bigeumensis]